MKSKWNNINLVFVVLALVVMLGQAQASKDTHKAAKKADHHGKKANAHGKKADKKHDTHAKKHDTHAKAHAWHDGHMLFHEAHKERFWNGKPRSLAVHAMVRYHKGNKNVDKNVHYGTWKWWWSNGRVKVEINYCDSKTAHKHKCHYGRKHGVSRGFYASGKLRWKAEYKDGSSYGPRVEYYENGKKKSSQQYEQGKRNGAYVQWWWNGRKAVAGQFVNGTRAGVWREWYENGRVKRKQVYSNGLLDGVTNEYWWVCRPTGCAHKKMLSGHWAKGKKHGSWTTWSLDGTSMTQQWKDGVRVQ